MHLQSSLRILTHDYVLTKIVMMEFYIYKMEFLPNAVIVQKFIVQIVCLRLIQDLVKKIS
jgi:hypothetical protein